MSPQQPPVRAAHRALSFPLQRFSRRCDRDREDRAEMISVASVWSISVLYCAGRHAALFSLVIVIHGRTTTLL